MANFGISEGCGIMITRLVCLGLIAAGAFSPAIFGANDDFLIEGDTVDDAIEIAGESPVTTRPGGSGSGSYTPGRPTAIIEDSSDVAVIRDSSDSFCVSDLQLERCIPDP